MRNANELQLSSDLGTAALIDMAERRGLHVSQHEAEQAWQEVVVEREEDRLSAAWKMLFKGHSAAPSPIDLLTNSQLPAWVIGKGCVGILVKAASADGPIEIEWVSGSPQQEVSTFKRAWVPVPPLADSALSFAAPRRRGPASEALVTAMWAHAPLFGRVAVASVFINAIAIVSSLFALQVYDRVVPNFAYPTLFFLASGVIIAYLLELLFKYSRLKMMEASTQRLDEALSLHFFDRIMNLKLDRRPTRVGTLVAQVRDYESVKAFFTSAVLFVLGDLPFVFIFITVIYLIGGPVAIVPAVFVVATVVVGLLAYFPIRRLQSLRNDAVVQRQGLLFEAVAGAEVVKAQGGEARFGDVWHQSTRETGERTTALNFATSMARNTIAFLQQMSYISILIVGVFTIADGNMTLGGMIACMILGGRTLGTISNITNLLLSWHHARYSLKVLNDLLSCPSDDVADRQANTKTEPLDLTVNDLAYGYGTSETPQLVVPALEIRQGERIAVLGRNGSGKSTLLKLLAGIANPSAGQVRIAGLDYQECRPSWLREVIAYLPQDVHLFSGTLLDNLTLGLSMPREEAIFAALEKTGLVAAVKAHPEGLHLPINEGGSGLSGGQRQLVGLTRMVLQNPRIWLLDEPTASLDNEAEAKLVELIRNLAADRTVIFTTHRQAWLDMASRVFILDGGQIRVDEPKEHVKAVASKRTALGSAPPPAPVTISSGVG